MSRQLHRAFHLGMTREDLLDQGRAGARQADDEYRIRGRTARADALTQELARKEPTGSQHETRGRFRLVAELAPAQTVRLGIVLK